MYYLSICLEELRETLVRSAGLHGEILIQVLSNMKRECSLATLGIGKLLLIY
jgi:hypothetical protein